jgi:L,D-peptidoglycan transpeptidase YkuD (ErfK/YbiS/YcfS/YnhG family)
MRCALGRSGVSASKREGDGATPAGDFPLRRVLFRADRLGAPATVLPASALQRDDGWCDDPEDPQYNRPVRLPYGGRHERMWREDGIYDLILVIGHNDDPVIPGHGSAVFVHLARPDFGPTQGCVAFARDDLLEILATCSNGAVIRIAAGANAPG